MRALVQVRCAGTWVGRRARVHTHARANAHVAVHVLVCACASSRDCAWACCVCSGTSRRGFRAHMRMHTSA
eukprot:15450844-Alexandrium_andersonii.AAC.1